MLETNINGCKCKYTGKEPSPTGEGYCPECYPEGTTAIGIDKTVWVIKTKPNGTNYWTKVATTSIHKDGEVWRCAYCAKEPAKKPYKKVVKKKKGAVEKKRVKKVVKKEIGEKVVCIKGKCQVQPQEARYYEFEQADPAQAVTVYDATYGDLLSRKGTYKCEEVYIVSKELVPERLNINSSSQCVIPDKYLNDLGIFYWDNIAIVASLGYPYKKEHFEELRTQLKKSEVSMEDLLKEYGIVIVNALVSKPKPPEEKRPKKVKKAMKKVSKKPAKRVSKKVSKRVRRKVSKRVSKKVSKKISRKRGSNLEKRSVTQLRTLAKKRGRKIPSGASKADLIKLLRGKKVITKRRGCYEAMSKARLLEIAAKRNIVGRSSMSKEKLINALRRR